MNKIGKIIGLVLLVTIIGSACQRGPHQETWGAGKPKKTMEKKQ